MEKEEKMTEDFREKANKDYPTIKKIFDKHGIKFFAFCGTALGAIRDGDFIPWDYDLDLASIGPLSLDKRQEVVNDFSQHGFEVVHRNPATDGNLWFKRNVSGDLYWMRLVDGFYTYTLDDGIISLKIPEKYFKKFIKKKLGDSEILVPDPPEPYLVATYGEDWRMPKKVQQGKFFFESEG